MITETQWKKIRKLFERAFRSSLHYAIATVNENGTPHVTPIGSLMLLDGNKGAYFEYFTRKMPLNFKKNQNVCVLAVNSGKWFWLKSLFRGKFKEPPAIRLRGTVGIKRKVSDQEKALWHKRIGPFRFSKGYYLLWKDMDEVREIDFHSIEFVHLGEMTQDANQF